MDIIILKNIRGMNSTKRLIGNGYRKFMPEPSTDTVLAILLEITKYTEVTVHEYRHDFTFRKPSLTIPAIFSIAAIGGINIGFYSVQYSTSYQTHR